MTASLLAVGTKAPDFTLPRDGGTSVSLADLLGRPLVLFFYPKANTPGCTTEARDFTALLAAFDAAGASVLGLSKDSVKKQDNFVAKHDLATPLLSDAQSEVCEAYGVWAEKKMYGKSFMGIVRTTYLIAADGTIARIWPKVKVAGHAQEVLAAVQSL